MAKIFHALAAVILAIAAPGSSALAQDGSEEAAARTPEAAQSFLAHFLQRGDWVAHSSDWFNGTTYEYFAGDGSGWHEVAEAPPNDGHAAKSVIAGIVDFTPLGPCKTRLNVKAKTLWPAGIGDPEVPIAERDINVEIDWSSVDPIKIREGFGALRSGGIGWSGDYWVSVWNPKARAGLTFVVQADKEKADRAAFAMSYLQQHCDPTAGSAF